MFLKRIAHMTQAKNGALQARALLPLSRRNYYENNVLMIPTKGDYFVDPIDVGERVVRLVALHDNVRDPSAIRLHHKFEDLGLDSLDTVEILLMAEQEFATELSDEVCEGIVTLNDLMEVISRNQWSS